MSQTEAAQKGAGVHALIRKALAHDRAAEEHERRGIEKAEQQRKAAGYELFSAFEACYEAAFPGRRVRDMKRFYCSKAKRPWWRKALKAAGVKDTAAEPATARASRIIQWHTDPEGARSAHATRVLRDAARRKRIAKQRPVGVNVARTTYKDREHTITPSEAKKVVEGHRDAIETTREREEHLKGDLGAILRVSARISSGARKVADEAVLANARALLEQAEAELFGK